ncbi:hypothetical protein JZ751_004511 [Albula glossodonta]|uniref:Uncharacterized protein n=1 Tax=Albula glossodonta TaxID=121402 RepID=A0A8T2N6C4_9TELE|nr:hypothetical protein JZ751_004511 [Albula glossodonta]
MTHAEPGQRISPVKNFVAGGVGGACLLFTGHPLDTIKVRLQTQPRASCHQSVLYTGTYDCLRKTLSKEGVTGLYRGMAAPLAGVAPMMAVHADILGRNACWSLHHCHCGSWRTDQMLTSDVPSSGLYFLTYECMKNCLTPDGQSVSQLSTPRILLAGGLAAVDGRYKGLWSVLLELIQEEGARALYKGFNAVMLRAFPANAKKFGCVINLMFFLFFFATNPQAILKSPRNITFYRSETGGDTELHCY